jgi:TonB family protein
MTEITFHTHSFDDAEFDTLLQSAMQERRNAIPAGLEQRLTARLAQAATTPTSPRNVQFAHFGVLRDGANSKAAFLTSIFANLIVAALVIVIGSAAHQQVIIREARLHTLTVPLKEAPKPPPPPPVKLTPPPPIPETPRLAQPRITAPDPVPAPPEIKPIVTPQPRVNLAPPAALKVEPPPAPRAVSLANAHAPSTPNADPHPSAVRLGSPDSPIKSPTGPAVSSVNLATGVSGMPPSNNGSGPASKSVKLGNGSPQGGNPNALSASVTPIKGLATGVLGATGSNRNGIVRVEIPPPAVALKPTTPTPHVTSPLARPPVVTYTPNPAYSAEAKAQHIEGDAKINVRFLANGTVQVLGLAHGLGHGLDQAALEAAQGIRFRPATDADGHAIDFQTTVIVHFLIN